MAKASNITVIKEETTVFLELTVEEATFLLALLNRVYGEGELGEVSYRIFDELKGNSGVRLRHLDIESVDVDKGYY